MSNPGSFLCLSLYLICHVVYLYLRHRLLQVGDICFLYPCLIQTLGNYHFMKVEMIQERLLFKTSLICKVWQCYYVDAKSLWDHASCKEKNSYEKYNRNLTMSLHVAPHFKSFAFENFLFNCEDCNMIASSPSSISLLPQVFLFDLFQIHGLLLY